MQQQHLKIFSILILLQGLINILPATAYEGNPSYLAGQTPEELKGLEVIEKTGQFVDLKTSFVNEEGEVIALKRYFKENKPVLLSIVYYRCPSLCGLHLNGVFQGLQFLPQNFKQQFNFVVVSMDETEDSKLAKNKKDSYIKKYSLPKNKVHFLTGSKENIHRLSREVGFRFRWDDQQKIFAHIPVAYVLSPKGQISRYLYGVQFDRQTLKLSLVEAGQGRIGSVIDRALLFCFQFDPKKGRYSWYAYNIMRAGGLLTVLLLFGFLIPVWIAENKKRGVS